MNRSVDAPAAEQRGIRGIDDGVERERRDVGDHDLEAGGADLGGEKGLERHEVGYLIPE